jgi:hypothetical protein
MHSGSAECDRNLPRRPTRRSIDGHHFHLQKFHATPTVLCCADSNQREALGRMVQSQGERLSWPLVSDRPHPELHDSPADVEFKVGHAFKVLNEPLGERRRVVHFRAVFPGLQDDPSIAFRPQQDPEIRCPPKVRGDPDEPARTTDLGVVLELCTYP